MSYGVIYLDQWWIKMVCCLIVVPLTHGGLQTPSGSIEWSWIKFLLKMHLNMSTEWQTVCSGLNVLTGDDPVATYCQWDLQLQCSITHCALWCHMATTIWVNIGSGNGLLPDGTKPLPEPLWSTHQWGLVAFPWEQFQRKCSIYLSLIGVWIWLI